MRDVPLLEVRISARDPIGISVCKGRPTQPTVAHSFGFHDNLKVGYTKASGITVVHLVVGVGPSGLYS